MARLEGRLDEARARAQRTIEAFATVGNHLEGRGWGRPGAIETLEGHLSAALTAREQADAIQVRFDQQTIVSTSQALLAELHRQRGDLDAAHAAIGLAAALSAPEDVITDAVGHGVRARLAPADGHWDEAERWGRQRCALRVRDGLPRDAGRGKADTRAGAMGTRVRR